MLLDNLYGPLDAAVCEQIITESHGNPLALLELPRTWTTADLAGGFGLPGRQPVVTKVEQSYTRRLLRLPANTRLLVLVGSWDFFQFQVSDINLVASSGHKRAHIKRMLTKLEDLGRAPHPAFGRVRWENGWKVQQ